MTSNKAIRVIGIAGGIGSGKTTLTSYLRKNGYTVVDADEISRKITRRGAPAVRKIGAAFGSDVISSDGSLDRKAVARIVFADNKKLRKLNDILHGEIDNEVDRQLAAPSARPVFLSAPLFFEADYEKKCDAVWALTASSELRVKRACERDSSAPGDVIARIMTQIPDEELIEKADIIINNDGTVEELFKRVDELLEGVLLKGS